MHFSLTCETDFSRLAVTALPSAEELRCADLLVQDPLRLTPSLWPRERVLRKHTFSLLPSVHSLAPLPPRRTLQKGVFRTWPCFFRSCPFLSLFSCGVCTMTALNRSQQRSPVAAALLGADDRTHLSAPAARPVGFSAPRVL